MTASKVRGQGRRGPRGRRANPGRRYLVDVPNAADVTAAWVQVGEFASKREAIVFVRDTFGGDHAGRIGLVSTIGSAPLVGGRLLSPDASQALAIEVYDAAVLGTETLEDDDHIGADAAYLMAAILKDGRVEVSEHNAPFHKLLMARFPKGHAVWTFIDVTNSGGGNGPG